MSTFDGQLDLGKEAEPAQAAPPHSPRGGESLGLRLLGRRHPARIGPGLGVPFVFLWNSPKEAHPYLMKTHHS